MGCPRRRGERPRTCRSDRRRADYAGAVRHPEGEWIAHDFQHNDDLSVGSRSKSDERERPLDRGRPHEAGPLIGACMIDGSKVAPQIHGQALE